MRDFSQNTACFNRIMTKKRRVIMAALLLAAGAWWWLLRPTEKTDSLSRQERDDPHDSTPPLPSDDAWTAEGPRDLSPQEQHFLNAFKTPIEFWGRVEDLEGGPVPGASVTIYVLDHFVDEASTYHRQSEVDGSFEIRGIKGASISVNVEKQGYEQVVTKDLASPSSNRRITYANPESLRYNRIPTPDEPTVFLLRKKLEADVLNRMERKRYDLPIDGTPLAIDLATGETGSGDAALEIRCWATPEKRYGEGRNAPFDWRFEISVHGGGLLAREDPNRVMAPEEGYGSVVAVEMPGSLPTTEWRWSVSNLSYWVRLGNGTYAMFGLSVRAGRQNLVYVDSWHNPTGSRNLEHDPANENRIK